MVSLVNHSKQLRNIPFFHKHFQKTEKEGTHPNSLYEVSITLMPKLKDIKRQENYRLISLTKKP